MTSHLFAHSFFINNFCDFLEKNYDVSKHRIIEYRRGDYKREDLKKDYLIDYRGKKDIGRLYHILKGSDRIVIHSLGVEIEMLALFYLCPKLCKKTVWIIWGSDLYCKRDPHKGLMAFFIEHMRETVISRFPYIGCLVTGDYDLAKEWYKTGAEKIRVNYIEPSEKEMIDRIMASTTRPDDGVTNIIVGNSGTKTNRHLELIDDLKVWKDANIRIYLPLSYGDKEYIEKVKEEYKKAFGDKAVIIDSLMSLEDYLTMLYKMDIGIFNNDRQQALGNIFALMYMGKKVCLKKGTSMWNELADIRGSALYDCGRIGNDDFLRDLPDKDMKARNVNTAMMLHYDPKSMIPAWNRVFRIDV